MTFNIHDFWYEHFTDVPLTETRWFEGRDPIVLAEALAVAAGKDKKGRFKDRTQANIGRYVNGVYKKLVQRKGAAGASIDVTVTMKFNAYRITDQDNERFRLKLCKLQSCLLFKGCEMSEYGRFHCDGGLIGAHVFAYYSHHVGHLPAKGQDGLQIAHSLECSTPACCNYEHLRLTTRLVNLSERNYEVEQEIQMDKVYQLVESVMSEPGSTAPGLVLSG